MSTIEQAMPAAAGGQLTGHATIDVDKEQLVGLAHSVNQVGSSYGAQTMSLVAAAPKALPLLVAASGREAAAQAARAGSGLSALGQNMGKTSANVMAAYHGYESAEQAVMGAFGSFMNGARSIPSKVFDRAKGLFSAFGQNLGQWWNETKETIWQAAIPAMRVLAAFGSKAYNVAKYLYPDAAVDRIKRLLMGFGVSGVWADAITQGSFQAIQRLFGYDPQAPKIRDGRLHEIDKDNMPAHPPLNADERARRMKEANDMQYGEEEEKRTSGSYAEPLVDVYQDPQSGQYIVEVYIPGTDGDAKKLNDPASVYANGSLAHARSTDALKDSAPYMQLVDKQLRALGIDKLPRDKCTINLTGHSQGGATAYLLANNNEFYGRYNVGNVYTYGAPIEHLEDRGDKKFKVHQYQDIKDPVPHIITGDKWEERPGDTHVVLDRSKYPDAPEPDKSTHDMNHYHTSISEGEEAIRIMGDTNAHKYEAERSAVYTGTTAGHPGINALDGAMQALKTLGNGGYNEDAARDFLSQSAMRKPPTDRYTESTPTSQPGIAESAMAAIPEGSVGSMNSSVLSPRENSVRPHQWDDPQNTVYRWNGSLEDGRLDSVPMPYHGDGKTHAIPLGRLPGGADPIPGVSQLPDIEKHFTPGGSFDSLRDSIDRAWSDFIESPENPDLYPKILPVEPIYPIEPNSPIDRLEVPSFDPPLPYIPGEKMDPANPDPRIFMNEGYSSGMSTEEMQERLALIGTGDGGSY
ncbi:MAG: hypothetical protein Q4P78_01115 [Rothia sp. (in: high G+C Gram-positive bacteria)]|uniref:lipase family protein n=1 Tax=Rothia sp. (in: high G+C Gram-positive bacteria) TaxID=1885016 RepID=UPI0026DFB55E|nr:hypothetical protein [Rothia sp. (in: high G+C Gram-positive bacteria)]MDO5749786.1 hypothetical protein [Rothia sp. (in: high G+C Gram-positive bacteria)]